MWTIEVVGLIQCSGSCVLGCKAEAAAARRLARAKVPEWPPVPKGYGPPASHLRKPTATSPHPLEWVNAALRPAYLRMREAYMRETPSAIAAHARAEAEAHKAYAARLAAEAQQATQQEARQA